MTTRRTVAPLWNRSDVLNFWELSEDQQGRLLTDRAGVEERQDLEADHYVIFRYPNREEVLRLSDFMRFDPQGPRRVRLWDGYHGTSYFSCYFIKLSPCGTVAVVAERYG